MVNEKIKVGMTKKQSNERLNYELQNQDKLRNKLANKIEEREAL